MNLSVGIVGLPNVGKSTLFNALLKKQQALAANYPFATIEPNVGIVPVPDERLEKLAEITALEIASSSSTPRNDELKLPPIKPALIEFVDIAGLVKGASVGEGLGNKFLSHIREVKVIAHVVRAFEDADVIREGSIGVKEDYETVAMELILADIETVGKSKGKNSSFAKATKDKQNAKVQVKNQNEILEKIEKCLDGGKPVRSLDFTHEEQLFVDQLGLLTAKPEIIVLNVAEKDYSEEKFEKIINEYSSVILGTSEERTPESGSWSSSPRFDRVEAGQDDGIDLVVVSAKIESELAELGDADAKEYLKELGVEKSGLEMLINKAYEKLGLISFLTAGEKEVRAWTIKKGTNAVQASGEIHTDFMAKFIKAEVVSYKDFIGDNGLAPRSLGEVGWKNARLTGKARLEGRDYIVKDGDVVEFKIGR